jgi:ATP-dependent 26S proteasome regulatory subunit
MNVGNLPPALIRSGRIELWLEMRLPDTAARAAIIKQLSAKIPATMGTLDIESAAAASEGLTGADLTRLIEDTKTLFAYDKAKNIPQRTTTDYLLDALKIVRSNKAMYEQAEAQARKNRPTRPPWFNGMDYANSDDDDDES